MAAALLTSEAAMAKRLTRTRQKIALARIPYRVPTDAELPERLATVCGVVHALYTAGHAPLTGESVLDVDLCAEGLRLARELHQLLPDEAMPAAVLALILLTEARRPARTDEHGDLVPLADQDRSRWDRSMVDEGIACSTRALRRTDGIADPYQLQAAIAAEHARAPDYRAPTGRRSSGSTTCWCRVAPSDPAALSPGRRPRRARWTPKRGLHALEQICGPSPRWHAVRSGSAGPSRPVRRGGGRRSSRR